MTRQENSEHEHDARERAIAEYHSGLTDREANELMLWGEFALCEFPAG